MRNGGSQFLSGGEDGTVKVWGRLHVGTVSYQQSVLITFGESFYNPFLKGVHYPYLWRGPPGNETGLCVAQ